MKKALIGLMALATACTPATGPKGDTYDLSATGIEWHEGLDAVTGGEKPILLFQLLGDFDNVFS